MCLSQATCAARCFHPWYEVTVAPSSSHLCATCCLPLRFCAQYRQYKYFIVQDRGAAGGAASGSGLDIDRMREAAQHFRGQHDFRNFCKVWLKAVVGGMKGAA